MKKKMFFAFILIMSADYPSCALAGSPTCTTVTEVTTGDSYLASDSDCVIKVTRPFSFTSFTLTLPETGGTYTVQNGAVLNTDHCENYGDEESGPINVCQPRAITVESANSENTVANAQSDTLADLYLQEDPHRESVVYTWDSVSNWDATYGYQF